MTPRPNILLIICDQLRADHLGCYGNRTVRTPAIDSIAKRGVAFDQFYVASPVCQPNRATLATGRMPSLHGVRINGISLSLAANTFIDMLRVNDWRTALIGKGHLQNFGGVSPSLKRPAPPDGYTAPPKGFDEADKEDRGDPIYDQENAKTFAANPEHDLRRPYYGFEHVELCSQHSTRVQGHYTQWLRERRPDGDKLRGPDNQLPHDYVMPQAWRTALPEELYPTSYVVERTLAYLDGHARNGSDKPFFVQCSFPDPHHPFTPPGRYWDMFKPSDMELPAAFHVGNRPLPPHAAALHAARDNGTRVADSQPAFAVTERETREAIALTYGMIAMIDDGVAKILKRLDELGLAKNTVVVFTSDHGDLMGDHQLMLKGNYAYQRTDPRAVHLGGAGRRPRRDTDQRARRHARYRRDHARSREDRALQRHPGPERAAGHERRRRSRRHPDRIWIAASAAWHHRRDGDAHPDRSALPDHLLSGRALG